MDLNTTQEILVIILAAMLAIFLALSIAASVLAIRLFLALKRIASKVERVADSAEHVGRVLKYSSNPVSLFRIVRDMVKGFKEKGR